MINKEIETLIGVLRKKLIFIQKMILTIILIMMEQNLFQFK